MMSIVPVLCSRPLSVLTVPYGPPLTMVPSVIAQTSTIRRPLRAILFWNCTLETICATTCAPMQSIRSLPTQETNLLEASSITFCTQYARTAAIVYQWADRDPSSMLLPRCTPLTILCCGRKTEATAQLTLSTMFVKFCPMLAILSTQALPCSLALQRAPDYAPG